MLPDRTPWVTRLWNSGTLMVLEHTMALMVHLHRDYLATLGAGAAAYERRHGARGSTASHLATLEQLGLEREVEGTPVRWPAATALRQLAVSRRANNFPPMPAPNDRDQALWQTDEQGALFSVSHPLPAPTAAEAMRRHQRHPRRSVSPRPGYARVPPSDEIPAPCQLLPAARAQGPHQPGSASTDSVPPTTKGTTLGARPAASCRASGTSGNRGT